MVAEGTAAGAGVEVGTGVAVVIGNRSCTTTTRSIATRSSEVISRSSSATGGDATTIVEAATVSEDVTS